jgi:hypothetical protein
MQRLCAQWLLMLSIVATASFAQQAMGEWISFTAPDKSFSVLFPDQPRLNETKEAHAHNYVWLYAVPGQRVFLAGNTDYDVNVDVEGELKADQDNFLKAVQARLVTSRRFEFERGPNDKLQAIEFTGESTDFNFKGIAIVEKQRAYMFCVGGRGNLVASTDKFINSVKLSRL